MREFWEGRDLSLRKKGLSPPKPSPRPKNLPEKEGHILLVYLGNES
jgi:hypothetical protein